MRLLWRAAGHMRHPPPPAPTQAAARHAPPRLRTAEQLEQAHHLDADQNKKLSLVVLQARSRRDRQLRVEGRGRWGHQVRAPRGAVGLQGQTGCAASSGMEQACATRGGPKGSRAPGLKLHPAWWVPRAFPSPEMPGKGWQAAAAATAQLPRRFAVRWESNCARQRQGNGGVGGLQKWMKKSHAGEGGCSRHLGTGI